MIPMLLILMVGIMEFSRAWMAKNILTGAHGKRPAVAADNTAGALVTATNRGMAVLNSASITTGPIVC